MAGKTPLPLLLPVVLLLSVGRLEHWAAVAAVVVVLPLQLVLASAGNHLMGPVGPQSAAQPVLLVAAVAVAEQTRQRQGLAAVLSYNLEAPPLEPSSLAAVAVVAVDRSPLLVLQHLVGRVVVVE
jgi:hypothetical protein